MIMKFMRKIFVAPIVVYQKLISPLLPGSCIYFPTCSSYAVHAVLHHGILKGTLLAVTRILRCAGGLFTGGDDPVPDNFTARYITHSYKEFWRSNKIR